MTEQSVHKTPPASPLQSIEEQDSPNFVPSTETFNQTRDDRVGDPKAQSENTKKQQQQHESQSPQSSRLKQRPQTGVVQHDHPSIQRQEQSQSALPTRASMNRQPTASGSFYCGCGVTSQRRPSLYSKVASQNAIQTVPSHTVAGPNTMNGQSTQGPVYQDPEYQSMNPRYGKDNEKPVWGLAKPLPRVVRPGMRRNETTDQKSYNTNPRGEAEPAPELGATPGLANSRSNATDRRTAPPPPQHPPTYASAAQEGLPQEYAVCEAQPDGLLRPMENEVEDGSRTTQEENMVQPPREEFLNQWVRVRHLLKEPFAEWLATTIALLIGLCGTLAVSTGGTSAGTILSKNWAWGLGSMVGIYLAGGVSGAHLNPGISIALWVFRGFPGRRCCYYIVAQLLGGLTAAGLAYCIYRDSIVAFAPTVSAGSSGLGFYTEPLSHVSSVTAFFTEFIADAILLCVVFAMGDDSNAPPGAGMHSFVIGLVIYVICIGLGFNTGGCLNPVRDFGPRIVALLAGYGVETFTARSGWWFWGGWVATITGCLVGATLYDTFIFIGGESPINYAPRRRRRAKLKKESKWRKRLGIGKEKLPSLEEGIKKLED